MLNKLERLLNWSSGLMAAIALFALMWLTLFDVSGRKFLNNSVPGGLEMTEILMVIVIFGALPMVSLRSEHVVFDTLDAFIPDWLKGIQTRIVHLICAATFAMMAWLMTTRAERFAEYGDITVHLQFPLAPVAWLMSVLLLLTAMIHLMFGAAPPAPAVNERPAREGATS